MATCSATTLLASGAALQALSKRELQIVICQLLCEINTAGGVGGAGAGYVYVCTADPNAELIGDGVLGASSAALCYSATKLWQWNGSTWV